MPTKTRSPKRNREAQAWWTGKPAVRMTKWIPGGHSPHPKQHAWLWLTCREALYGGAAGGGKSDAMLSAALQYVDVPDYAAILFRRTFADLSLPGALMDRAKQWLAGQPDVDWNEQRKTFTFPSGATLSFGYLQYEQDKYRYQSAEFQFIGFDELTQFPQEDYEYLFSRLRRPADVGDDNPLSQVPLRMRAASNPGGRGHRWVKHKFIDKSTRGDRVFIPASLADNPSIDQKTYIESLMQLDEQTRLQLLKGDWSARGPGHWMINHLHLDAAIEMGRHYGRLMDRGAIPPPLKDRMSGGIDWGEITQAYAIWELEKGGVYVPSSEVVSAHGEPGDATIRILKQWRKFGYALGDARYDSAGVQSMRTFVKTARAQPGLAMLRSTAIPFNSYKKETIKYLRFLAERSYRYLHGIPDELGRKMDSPVQVLAIDPRNITLCDQIYEWERKDEETDDAVKENDHGPDAVVAGVAPIARRHRQRVQKTQEDAKQRNGGQRVAA